MSSEPSPEEQKKLDAETKAKEQAEQAALPYKWDQTIKDLDITVSVESKYKGKDLEVKIGRNTLKVGIKGQAPVIDVCVMITQREASLTFTRANSLTPSVSTTLPGP
jgi:hypothetical protein